MKKIFVLLLVLVMALTVFGCGEKPVQLNPGDPIEIAKSIGGNPLGGWDAEGKLTYGGDPSVLVDGDTVYLYVGHDMSLTDSYVIPEYLCYSSKDLVNWTYHGVVLNMKNVSWANMASAWAGQVAKHYDEASGKDMYYFYYCSWDSTDSDKQSIGVAVSDSPTGTFVDIGSALVKGSFTTDETSAWNDIDPTVWIEKDENGEEHIYLAWGNGKFYICELNPDMVSVKDIDGDGEVVFGKDLVSAVPPSSFTEAAWLYRRQDADGNHYGDYYVFYAYGWREQLAYSRTSNLFSGEWENTAVIMQPTATSNTNHPAVFDFQGKTYMIYHNGSMPGGNGYRRVACIAELKFNEDGSVEPVMETATGLGGTISYISLENGEAVTHEHFNNASSDVAYPYTNRKVGGTATSDYASDKYWEIVAGKSDPSDAYLVSIESYNKAGLYLTATADGQIVLGQDHDKSFADAQTFKTVSALDGKGGVSFESVAFPGQYLSIVDGVACLTDGSDPAVCSFNIATVV